jgi:hypothetical protein
MEYVIPIVIVMLAIAGFVGFMVINATSKGGSAANGEDAPGIGEDETPLGDTTEHAGEQTEAGTTVGKADAEESGGTGRPVHSGAPETSAAGHDPADPDGAAHVVRPGEAEGAEQAEFTGKQPEQPAETTPGSRPAG